MGVVNYVIFFIMGLATGKQSLLMPLSENRARWEHQKSPQGWRLENYGNGYTCRTVCGHQYGLMCDEETLGNMDLSKAKEAAAALNITCVGEWDIADGNSIGASCSNNGCTCWFGANNNRGCLHEAQYVEWPQPRVQLFCPCVNHYDAKRSCSASPLEGTPIKSYPIASDAMAACDNMPTCFGYQDRSCDRIFQPGGSDFFLCGEENTWTESASSCIVTKATQEWDPWGSLSETLKAVTQSRPT